MTNEEKATALKGLVDTLAQDGEQWLLQEPFIWEKDPEWGSGDITSYPDESLLLTEEALKAGAAIDEIVSKTVFKDTFTCVFRDGEMMVFSVPEWFDIMIPFNKGEKVYLSRGDSDLYRPGKFVEYYDIYPNTNLSINGEKVDQERQALTEAGLEVHGSWQVRGEGIAYRCQPKHPIISIRQESKKTGLSVHGAVWDSPTCIFYKV
jgi:hypothetical protein